MPGQDGTDDKSTGSERREEFIYMVYNMRKVREFESLCAHDPPLLTNTAPIPQDFLTNLFVGGLQGGAAGFALSTAFETVAARPTNGWGVLAGILVGGFYKSDQAWRQFKETAKERGFEPREEYRRIRKHVIDQRNERWRSMDPLADEVKALELRIKKQEAVVEQRNKGVEAGLPPVGHYAITNPGQDPESYNQIRRVPRKRNPKRIGMLDYDLWSDDDAK